MKLKAKHIPNILSLFRLLLVGVYVAVYFGVDHPNSLQFALCIFVLAGVTDIIDGYLARKYNWISNLGKILDPLADKMMQCTALICLLADGRIPIWFALPFILKELLMLSGGLFMMREKKIIVVSNVVGKIAALFFYVAVGLVMLLGDALGVVATNVLCGVSLGVTVIALIVYFIQYFSNPEKKQNKASK